MVVSPKVLLEEMDMLNSKGVSTENLRLDLRAHLIMPYHIVIDTLSEKAKGTLEIAEMPAPE